MSYPISGKWLPGPLAIVVALTFAIGFTRSAQGAAADKISAKAHYEAATRLYDVHEYENALAEYKAGYLTKPDPAFLFNIGQCYKKLGKPEQAREFFREYLKKAATDDPNRAQAEARIRELDNRDATNLSTPATGSAESHSAPAAPEASLADRPAAKAATQPATPFAFSAAPAVTTVAEPAGVDLSASASHQPENRAPAFYRSWWFWTGVGAAVVVGTVTAVALAGNSGNSPNVSGTTLGTRTVLQ